MTRPTHGSLFSGIGGMDMGFDTYMDCVFQVEWDKNAQSILRRHWPDVPKWSDVQDVNGAELPPCDVLTFGSPCQDLSVAGKRAGLDGGRSSMFYEAVRIIKEMRDATSSRPDGPFPRVAVWENVPGALSSNGGEDFGVVLDELARVGAVEIEWGVLDAQHFGVPQRRRRVFVVAVFDPAIAEGCPDPLLPVAEGRPRDFAKGRKKGEDAAGRSEDGTPDGRGYRMLGFGHYADDDTASALKQRDYKDATDLAVIPVIFDGTRHDDFRMDTEIVPTLKQRMGTGGGQVPMVFEPGAIGRLNGERHSKDVSHTLRANMGDNLPAVVQPFSFDTQFGSNANVFTDLSPTLKATQSAPSVTTQYAVRRLTPLECERLMGYPDDHTRWTDEGKEQADTHRYKQCGNGVATPVARWIAGHLARVISSLTK